MSDDQEWRRTALAMLDAGRPFLERGSRREFARELIVQALDAIPEGEWMDAFCDALDELAKERAADNPAGDGAYDDDLPDDWPPVE